MTLVQFLPWPPPTVDGVQVRGKRRRTPPPKITLLWVFSHVAFDPSGCVLWQGVRSSQGYAIVHRPASPGGVRLHRFVYEQMVGPIADGNHIDHTCRVRHCINPHHLQSLTPADHAGLSFARHTHCPHGHEFTDENTYVGTYGERCCRTCRRTQRRERYLASRAASQAADKRQDGQRTSSPSAVHRAGRTVGLGPPVGARTSRLRSAC